MIKMQTANCSKRPTAPIDADPATLGPTYMNDILTLTFPLKTRPARAGIFGLAAALNQKCGMKKSKYMESQVASALRRLALHELPLMS